MRAAARARGAGGDGGYAPRAHACLPFPVCRRLTPPPLPAAYFLTHTHCDHTVKLSGAARRGAARRALRTAWRRRAPPRRLTCRPPPDAWALGPLYCSSVARALLRLKHPALAARAVVLQEGEATRVPLGRGCPPLSVTLFPSGHCPGSAAFLFVGPGCGTVLHTGDWRHERGLPSALLAALARRRRSGADTDDDEAEMHRAAPLVDTLFLDNTFCHPSFVHPPRTAALATFEAVISSHDARAGPILLGIDSLGKEELLEAASRAARSRVCVSEARLAAITAAGLPTGHLTTVKKGTAVLTAPRWRMTPKMLAGCKSRVGLAIHPTGWPNGVPNGVAPVPPSASGGGEGGGGGAAAADAAPPHAHPPPPLRCVPYSLHANFNELRQLVATLRPRRVVGLVPQRAGGWRHASTPVDALPCDPAVHFKHLLSAEDAPVGAASPSAAADAAAAAAADDAPAAADADIDDDDAEAAFAAAAAAVARGAEGRRRRRAASAAAREAAAAATHVELSPRSAGRRARAAAAAGAHALLRPAAGTGGTRIRQPRGDPTTPALPPLLSQFGGDDEKADEEGGMEEGGADAGGGARCDEDDAEEEDAEAAAAALFGDDDDDVCVGVGSRPMEGLDIAMAGDEGGEGGGDDGGDDGDDGDGDDGPCPPLPAVPPDDIGDEEAALAAIAGGALSSPLLGPATAAAAPRFAADAPPPLDPASSAADAAADAADAAGAAADVAGARSAAAGAPPPPPPPPRHATFDGALLRAFGGAASHPHPPPPRRGSHGGSGCSGGVDALATQTVWDRVGSAFDNTHGDFVFGATVGTARGAGGRGGGGGGGGDNDGGAGDGDSGEGVIDELVAALRSEEAREAAAPEEAVVAAGAEAVEEAMEEGGAADEADASAGQEQAGAPAEVAAPPAAPGGGGGGGGGGASTPPSDEGAPLPLRPVPQPTSGPPAQQQPCASGSGGGGGAGAAGVVGGKRVRSPAAAPPPPPLPPPPASPPLSQPLSQAHAHVPFHVAEAAAAAEDDAAAAEAEESSEEEEEQPPKRWRSRLPTPWPCGNPTSVFAHLISLCRRDQ